jgi:hypothetical protein
MAEGTGHSDQKPSPLESFSETAAVGLNGGAPSRGIPGDLREFIEHVIVPALVEQQIRESSMYGGKERVKCA